MTKIFCSPSPSRFLRQHNLTPACAAKVCVDTVLHWSDGSPSDVIADTPSHRGLLLPGAHPTYDQTAGIYLAVVWVGCAAADTVFYIVPVDREDDIEALVAAATGTQQLWAVVARLSMRGILYNQQ